MRARRDIFQAIADPVRRDIIDLLAKDILTVNEVAEKFDISRPAVSKHLKILDECGLLVIRKEGRERYCSVDPKSLIPAYVWIEQYHKLWEDRIDAFEDLLTELKTKNDEEHE